MRGYGKAAKPGLPDLDPVGAGQVDDRHPAVFGREEDVVRRGVIDRHTGDAERINVAALPLLQCAAEDGPGYSGSGPEGPGQAVGVEASLSFRAACLRDFLATLSCDSMSLRSRLRLTRSCSTALTASLCFFKLARSRFSVFAA